MDHFQFVALRPLAAGRLIAASLAVLALCCCVTPQQDSNRRVQNGLVAGSIESNVLSFKGIPYAAPPIGALRWRAPQPAAAWSGVRQTTAFGHDCMQKPFSMDQAPLRTEPAEDCLYLNVWRPAQASRKALPVIVWIHGGGFVTGGSSPAIYSGEAFARDGLVFVSFNYRLGRFGFFGFPALDAEQSGEPKVNYGYLDQIAALRWVKRNIAAFGGDPSNVTVFGESAGGGSVHMLLTSSLAKGLFQRAIIESGGGRGNLMGEHSPQFAAQVGVNFANRYGIEGTDAAALTRLRALTAEQVTDGLSLGSLMTASDKAPTYCGPIVDGRIVTDSPRHIYESGRQAHVPLLVGANSADLGFASGKTKEELFAAFGAHADQARSAYDLDGSAKLPDLIAAIGRDQTMVEPARFAATVFAQQNIPSYEYRFSYVAAPVRALFKGGAPHATEIPYVFDTLADVAYGSHRTPADDAVAHTVHAYWVNFAKSGDPNGAGLPQWPRYSAATDILLDFRADGSAAAAIDPLHVQLDVVAAAQTSQ